jgi:hypothetical protein
MKTFKSMPKETAFFDRYANLIHSLTRFAVVAQLVTGLTEIGIIYSLLYPSISDLAPSYAAIITTPLSILFASLLQVGLKKVFPYSVKAILYKRFKSLDLAFTIAVFVLTIALLIVSILLSYKGSRDIVDIAIQPPTEKTTTATDSTRAAAERQANATFTTDSATIETKFAGKSEAIQSDYLSRASGYDAQAARAKGSIYKAELTAKANGIRAELKTKLATLQSDKATEIEAKATERKATIQRATDKNDQATAEIKTANSEAKGKAEQRKGRYKNYVGYFTMFCYVFFLIAFVLDEIYKRGAQIDETPQPHQRHFLPSLFAEWIEAIKARFDTWVRAKIYAYSDKTKASPLPNALNSLYDFKADALQNVWTIQTEPQETKVIKLPSKPLRIAAKSEMTDGKSGVSDEKKSRQIGFFKQQKTDEMTDGDQDKTAKTATDVTAAVMHEKPQPKVKNCEWCNNSFEYVVYNKKYCCETCKKQAWEAKTGVNFDLELKKKERQKKK